MLSSLLPGGDVEDPAADAIFDRVEPSQQLQNCMLAVVQADPSDNQETVRDASVIGFLYVVEVEEKKRRLRVLAPLSGRIPRNVLILGMWPESVGDLVG